MRVLGSLTDLKTHTTLATPIIMMPHSIRSFTLLKRASLFTLHDTKEQMCVCSYAEILPEAAGLVRVIHVL